MATKTNAIPQYIGPGHWRIESLAGKRAGTFYDLIYVNNAKQKGWTCTCYNYIEQGNNNCKHIQRLREYADFLRAEKAKKTQQTPIHTEATAIASTLEPHPLERAYLELSARMKDEQKTHVECISSLDIKIAEMQEIQNLLIAKADEQAHIMQEEMLRLEMKTREQQKEINAMQSQIDALSQKDEMQSALINAANALVEIHESRRRPRTKKIVQEIEMISSEEGCCLYLVDGKHEVVLIDTGDTKYVSGCNCAVGKFSICEGMKKIQAKIDALH